MVDNSAADESTTSTFNRRSYLAGIGGGSLLLGTPSLLGSVRGDEPASGITESADEETIDLGQEGLEPGDEIDEYLEEYFESDADVVIPAGEYAWNGEGLGGDYENASLTGAGDPGDVQLRIDDGDERYSPIHAVGGEVRIENVTLRGETGGDTSKVRADAPESDATLILKDVWLPDGVEEGTEGNGIYVGKEHSGTVKLIDCWIEGFADNGLYASAPGTDDDEAGDGPVIVEGGLFKNNNISNVRLGSSESTVRGATLVHDDVAPENSGSINQRNLRIRQPGEDLLVEGCDIYHEIDGNHPVDFSSQIDGGSGTIRTTRVYTESDSSAINDHDGEWVAERLHITGSGDDSVEIEEVDTCRDEECQRATSTATGPITEEE